MPGDFPRNAKILLNVFATLYTAFYVISARAVGNANVDPPDFIARIPAKPASEESSVNISTVFTSKDAGS